VSLSQIDLNLLLVLDTVLSERSVVGAARRLHVTPSAISNALARLRSEFGDPLVVRSGRGIVPTPRAAELAPSLKQALSELERVIQNDVFDPATTTRQFTLALADASQIARLPSLLMLLGKEMPRSRLRVVGIDTYVSSGGIAGTEVDVALIRLEAGGPGIHMTSVYEEESVLAARRGHPKTRKRITTIQLAGLQHVDVQVAPGRGYPELAPSYARLNIERVVAVVVPSFIAAAAVVAKTDFVATLPVSLVETLGERFGLQVITGPAPRITTEIKLVWHERTHDDPAMRVFRELVVRAAGGPGEVESGRPHRAAAQPRNMRGASR
jgi:DNA-binding transcriptional LysR family regulator